MALNSDQIRQLLKEDANKPRGGGGSRTKADITEVREITVWIKLPHHIREEGCENPECIDPRPKNDYGTNVVAMVKEKWMCRYCFLSGWKSND